MSGIKALEKLRDELNVCGCDPDDCMCCEVPRKVKKLADEIEAEIERGWMLLPVDADGVPICVGDVVEFGENRNQGIVKALNEHMVIAMHVDDGCMNYAKYGLLWNADACRHVKPRTLEDVLREMLDRDGDGIGMREFNSDFGAFVTHYADEIRAMFEEVDCR